MIYLVCEAKGKTAAKNFPYKDDVILFLDDKILLSWYFVCLARKR